MNNCKMLSCDGDAGDDKGSYILSYFFIMLNG